MKNRKKIIFNGVFLAAVFALTIYGVFHGEDLSFMMDAIHRADKRWLLPGIALVAFFIWGESIIIWYMMHSSGIQSEKQDMLSVFVCWILFQLYHTVRKRQPADAALLYEKGENFHSGINSNTDDRHDHLQSGAGRGGTWTCSVRTEASYTGI